jgi:hypothetical protein
MKFMIALLMAVLPALSWAADAAESAVPGCIPVTHRNGTAAGGTIGVQPPVLIRD